MRMLREVGGARGGGVVGTVGELRHTGAELGRRHFELFSCHSRRPGRPSPRRGRGGLGEAGCDHILGAIGQGPGLTENPPQAVKSSLD